MGKHKRFPKTNIPISDFKNPKAVATISGTKRPVIAESVTRYDDQKAAWRIGKIQLIDPYGWHILDASGIARIKERLSSLERNTWNDIFVRDRHYNHKIRTDQLKCSIAKKWMHDHLPDYPYLWTIRVTGAERIWGIFAEGAYQIIFWDPRHLIWEVPKN